MTFPRSAICFVRDPYANCYYIHPYDDQKNHEEEKNKQQCVVGRLNGINRYFVFLLLAAITNPDYSPYASNPTLTAQVIINAEAKSCVYQFCGDGTKWILSGELTHLL